MTAIRSILENDLYKFSMSHYYQVHYPEASGTFEFKDRNNLEFDDDFIKMLKFELNELCHLFLNKAEFDYVVKNITYIPRYYWEWLQGFRFNPALINVYLDDDKHLHINVTDLMYKVTFYEIPILTIVSDVYHRWANHGYNSALQVQTAMAKSISDKVDIAQKHNLFFSDFGLRRRYNQHTEDFVVEYMKTHCKTFVGTSNVYLAMKYNVKPIGTMAHETFMFQAAVNSPKDANYHVMENWVDVFDGALGTVLTDTYTVDVFLRNFSLKLAKLYDGVRHDSGDPYEFGEKIIEKYRSYGIDPMSKTIVFSDALDFPTAAKLKEYFAGRIKVTFGIGTNLTCDLPDVKAMNVVMKLKTCRINDRQPLHGCVKLSDNPGKAMGHPDDIANYKYQLGIKD